MSLLPPINPKPGCRDLHKDVYMLKENCHHDNPVIEEVLLLGHFVSCHYVREINNLK